MLNAVLMAKQNVIDARKYKIKKMNKTTPLVYSIGGYSFSSPNIGTFIKITIQVTEKSIGKIP